MPKLIFLSSLFLCSAICFGQSGQPDPSFGNQGIVKVDMGSPFDHNSAGRQVLIQSGGSLYIIFNYPTFISKRLPDGSIDSSYGFDGYSRPIPFNDAFAALQPDGKIVIVGSGFSVARINTNGRPDSTFGNNGLQISGFNGSPNANGVSIQPDGKIVVVGSDEIDGDNYFAVARYNINGSPDNTFKGGGRTITDFGFKLPPEMGGTDSIPFHQQSATSVGIMANGKIVVGGYASNGTDLDFAVACYNVNGSLDDTFDNDGRQTTKIGSSDDLCYSLAIESDGKIVLAGYASVENNNHFAVVRYNSNGSLDSTFNDIGKQTASLGSDKQIGNSVAIQTDGKIVVAGYTLNGPSNNDFAVARFNINGSPDNSFGEEGISTTDFRNSDDYAGSVAIQADGKILVAGYSYNYLPVTVEHLAVLRYNTDGSTDSSFADNGKLVGVTQQGETSFNNIAVQNDGKIIAAGVTWNGNNYDFAVARFLIDGKPDSTFSDDGKQITDFGANDEAVSIVIQTDGKIIVAGNSDTQFALARYNSDGSPDDTFSDDGKLITSMGFADACQSVALQPNGKIIVAGYTYIDSNYDSSEYAIVRFNGDGTEDNSFGNNGKQLTDFGSYKNFATAVALQNDGKIVVAGRSYLNNSDNFSLARYNTDGSLDTGFSNDGKQNSAFGPDDYFAESLAIQNDGKIVLAGFSETSSGSSSAFAVARYKTNGDLDSTFSDDGFQSTYLGSDFNFGFSAAINGTGKIAVGGSNGNYAVVLYKNDGSPDSTFGTAGVEITDVGIDGSSIRSLAFSNNKLYAAGTGRFPGSFGVIVRYLLTDAGPLPVNLLNFTGILQNKSVLLQWEISTEKNLTGFVVERSSDGYSFLPINIIKASGLGTNRKYSIIDQQPLPGINYYRLKIVDIDGKFTYSNIVAIKINSANKLHVFPNPAKEILFIEATGNNENAILQIMDLSGKKIRERKVFLNGKTFLSENISSLPGGLYNLVLHTTEKMEVQTFIKN